MTSLRGLLTRWLVIAMTIVASIVGGVLYTYLHQVVKRDFDRAIRVRAHALEALVAIKPDGKWDLDIHAWAWPEYSKPNSGDYYRVVDDGGNVIIASAADPLRGSAVPAADTHIDSTFPDGRRVRVIAVRYRPPIEEDEDAKSHGGFVTKVDPPRPWVTVVVGRDLTQLNEQFFRIAVGVLATTGTLIIAAVIACTVIVRRGFSRLDAIAHQMTAIDFTQANVRLVPAELPSELAGVVAKFNQMLRRVETTLARERRFTADVAHELRTPIAELRTATDVARRQRAKPDALERGVDRAQQIAVRMQRTLDTLLAMARGEDLRQGVRLTHVDLADALERAIADLHAECPPIVHIDSHGLAVRIDADLFAAVLSNLLSNAVQYTTDVASVAVHYARDGQTVTLHIENAQAGLSPQDLPSMVEPFWRKDTARTGGTHLGLGLSLALGYCQAMDVSLRISLPSDDVFRVSLAMPIVGEEDQATHVADEVRVVAVDASEWAAGR